jgi:antitoxin VapB
VDSLRRVRIFKNGGNQAIRIPRELELQASEATIRKEGKRLVIEPVERASLLELLGTWRPLEVGLPEVPDAAPESVEL